MMSRPRIGDNQYENPYVTGPPCTWPKNTLGGWRQQCDDGEWLERPRDFTEPYPLGWDGEETTPEHWS